MREEPPAAGSNGNPAFVTTRWTVIHRAQEGDHPDQATVWNHLAIHYWYPLYAFARRSGGDADVARDQTQAFFVHLMTGDLLARADPQRGRFRTLLLGAFKNFLLMEARRQSAWKRGGGQVHFSLNEEIAEGRYRFEPLDPDSPDKLFERRWAIQIIARALDRLEAEVSARSNSRLFLRLKHFLTSDEGAGTCAEIGAEFGMSPGAVKAAVHRLRQRYRALVREEIASTVASPSEVDEELRHVLAVLTE